MDRRNAFSPGEQPLPGKDVRRGFKETAMQIAFRGTLIAATLGLGVHLFIADLSRTAHSIPKHELKDYIVERKEDAPYWPIAKFAKTVFFFSVKAGKDSAETQNPPQAFEVKSSVDDLSFWELRKKIAVNLIFGDEPLPRKDSNPVPASVPDAPRNSLE